jgi:hypothetical protein
MQATSPSHLTPPCSALLCHRHVLFRHCVVSKPLRPVPTEPPVSASLSSSSKLSFIHEQLGRRPPRSRWPPASSPTARHPTTDGPPPTLNSLSATSLSTARAPTSSLTRHSAANNRRLTPSHTNVPLKLKHATLDNHTCDSFPRSNPKIDCSPRLGPPRPISPLPALPVHRIRSLPPSASHHGQPLLCIRFGLPAQLELGSASFGPRQQWPLSFFLWIYWNQIQIVLAF